VVLLSIHSMLHVLHAGLHATVQDAGRVGFAMYGVPQSGAADSDAYRLANLLVGNQNGEAALEIVPGGFTLRAEHDTLIAAVGGEWSVFNAQEQATSTWQPLPTNRPVWIPAGTRIRVTGFAGGMRSYLALAGGVDVPVLMGSRSTYLRGAFGGYNGRILQKNDVLRCGTLSPEAERIIRYLCTRRYGVVHIHHGTRAARWSAPQWNKLRRSIGNPCVLRVTEGVHAREFTKPSQRLFFATTFHVTQEADRMGIRLAGQIHELPFLVPPMVFQQQHELISSAVLPGTVQVPPQSSPIVLLADAQTVGGYPIIASVCSADLSLLAQLRPGDKVRFQRISLAEAHELILQRERYFLYLRRALQVLGEDSTNLPRKV